MDLEYSLEQRQLKDSVERFVAQRCTLTQRQPFAESAARFNPEIWQSMADFGWLALALPEVDGGLGGSAVDLGILMESLAPGLVLEPVVTSAIVSGPLIAATGSAAQRDQWLGTIAGGRSRAALAHGEAGRSPYADGLSTRAERTADGWRISGRKTMVFDAPGADVLLVSAALPRDAHGAPDPIGLFLVPPRSAGLQLDRVELLDSRLAATLRLDGVTLPDTSLLAEGGDTRAAIDAALDRAVAAGCAEAVGCMQGLLDATVDYSRTRQQFGQPLAANQVLRHRMVNMAVQTEEARAMALRAALLCDAVDRDDDAIARTRARARGVSGAKLKVFEAARFVAESAVQLHGAMGVTDELSIGACFKRLLCLEMAWGTRADHLARCIASRSAAQGASAASATAGA